MTSTTIALRGESPAVSSTIARSLDVAMTRVVSRGPSSFRDLLPSTGHAWGVVKEPVFTRDALAIPGQYVTRRDDTHDILGIVGESYTPTQPMDLAANLDQVFDGLPIKLEGAMTVRKGCDLVLEAALPEELNLSLFGGKDVVRCRVLFRTSFDGRSRTSGYVMGRRLVCTNGMRVDSVCPGTVWGVRHTKHSGAARERAIADLRGWATQWKMFSDIMQRLAATRLPAATSSVRDLVTRIVLTPDQVLQGEKPTVPQSKRIETVLDLTERGFGTDIPGVRGTAWGVFQAVNEYANHYTPAKGTPEQQATRRVERILDGDDMSGRAFEVLTMNMG